ncbi:type IV pilus secretin PilQ [Desulfonatronum thioautotrophicum]|uniref:type IV pilus secretin PilQ n=1 Tax=Desulfonatronum thioautotrophicum TaxID=617001 RepID=UPI000AC85206|nr:type IV pilus secretin PilQ [Desulfonatronum thioautotrophicum]
MDNFKRAKGTAADQLRLTQRSVPLFSRILFGMFLFTLVTTWSDGSIAFDAEKAVVHLAEHVSPAGEKTGDVTASQEALEVLTVVDLTRKNVSPELAVRHASFFQTQDGHVAVRLEAAERLPWRTVSARPGQLRILFPDVAIPGTLTRLHQLHAFDHVVKTAMLRNTSDGAELVLTATGPVLVEPETVLDGLVLRFMDAEAAAAENGPAPERRAAHQDTLQDRPVQDALELRFPEEEALFPGMREEYVGTPISIDLQNAEVEHVLRLIGEVAGYNLILDAGVGGRISMKLDNVPWDQVLDLVLVQRNLGMVARGNILRISTAQQLESEREQRRRAREAAMQAQETIERLEPLQTVYIQINYAEAPEMYTKIRPFLSERGQLSHDSRTNVLILTDSPLRTRQIQGIIDRLDQPERQVMIEARVVYATDDFQRSLGIRWGGGIEGVTTEYFRGIYGVAQGPGGGPINQGGVDQVGYLVNAPSTLTPTFGIGGFISKLVGPDMFTLDAQLQLAEIKEEARTVSSPRVVTLNNSQAVIKQGTKVRVNVLDEATNVITPRFEDAVLELSVTPQITPDDQLILTLVVRDDIPIGENIDTKSAEAKLIISNGETIVLGGVFKAIESERENRVPGLANIPGLGNLFKSRTTEQRREELLIFIRPTIL